ncbi:CRISPR-associated endonuclease Cas3'' [Lampropedia puyangensis]|uniref:CRISPR-associated endonuclease Cas3 n=1 Tax=Lampropedia puyangensis TaxID=1330072 RepID=A0A4S8FA72_9BURK|nr:CRISPR-associated endonuclease Cas3'' [Lampropedia puyangensis]THU04473.1 CRISPR-associated endonuclease Cas3'' [Lampropedia puyangensis]
MIRDAYSAHSSLNPALSPAQKLSAHLLQVAVLASQSGSYFGASELSKVCGLLHDLGKYCEPFQRKLEGEKLQVNHSTWGAKIALEKYPQIGYLLAYVIAGHHAGLANGSGMSGERSSLKDRLADPHLPKLEEAWQHEVQLPEMAALAAELGQLKPANGNVGFSLAFLTRMIFSALVDADYLDTERYYDQFEPVHAQSAEIRARAMPTLLELRSSLDAYMQAFKAKSAANAKGASSEVNQLRAEILAYARAQASQAPGLFSLTVPTGGGKTLASLAFALDHAIAHGQRRVIFVIPFTSIVEQNASVFRDALAPWSDAVLEHHSAFTAPQLDQNDPERYQAQTKLRLAMENWDAPVIVTTAVQFFESLFAARTSQCRKLHNIAGSVVVIDEAQTIPLHVLRPAMAAMDELARNYKNSIVLCTATQPALEAPDFKGGLQNVRPLVKDEAKLAQQLERVRVRHIGNLDDEALTEHMRCREQVLCIVNNRLHARAVYQSMADLPGAIHLSTLMYAKHRSAVLATARQRLKDQLPCRIVSTSLIEAGVDISLPTVMRAEAGLDSIAQAAGRCNRNKEWPVDASEVLIFANTNAQWAPPPELHEFAKTANSILRQEDYRNAPLSPAAIKAYFDMLYWQKGDDQLDTARILEQLKDAKLHNLPFEDVEKQFQMIKSSQLPIIIGRDDEAEKALKSLHFADKVGGIARTLQPYTVQVPRNAFAALRQARAIQPVAPEKWGEQFMELVNLDLYSEEFGLWWEEPTFMEAASYLF